jgi:hypothetical protein
MRNSIFGNIIRTYVLVLITAGWTLGQAADGFEITEGAVGAGAGAAADAVIRVDLTLGQPTDGMVMFGGDFIVAIGFWNMTPPVPPVTPPAAPVNLAARAVSNSRIDLTWTDSSDNETNFELERCEGRGRCRTFMLIASPGQNVVAFSDVGLAANTQYTYRVRATNEAGTSDYSNTVREKTLRR